MTGVDLVGWLAAALTLLAFFMRSMTALRAVAIAANLCFLLYGAANWLYPVLVLHVLLLPCNAVRLYELLCEDWRRGPGIPRRVPKDGRP